MPETTADKSLVWRRSRHARRHRALGPNMDSPDVAAFLDALKATTTSSPPTEIAAASNIFDPSRPVAVARAPGRLDVMGGIADYSAHSCCKCQSRRRRSLRRSSVRPVALPSSRPYRSAAIPLAVHPNSRRRSTASLPARAVRPRRSRPSARNSARRVRQSGRRTLPVCSASSPTSPRAKPPSRACGGVSVLVSSAVPEGKGVSSSAAVEVATMMASLGALGVTIEPAERIAMLCQRVENFVVGAPCGIMDQMASALGAEGRLLPCCASRIPSRARSSQYQATCASGASIRACAIRLAAATMALSAVRPLWRRRCSRRSSLSAPRLQPTTRHNYRRLHCRRRPPPLKHLVELLSSLFEEIKSSLPTSISGADFLKEYGSHADNATTIEPETMYELRGCAAHPIYEHFRVGAFRTLLAAAPSTSQLIQLGELMYQSHASYSAVGLGSEATDTIVKLVRSLGPSSGLHGAKITGGGSGGTVCVLGAATAEAEASLQKVLDAYALYSGHKPHVFIGSSLGAVAFGHVDADMKRAPRSCSTLPR